MGVSGYLVLQPPLPLHPLSPESHPPWPLQSFWPLQSCLAVAEALVAVPVLAAVPGWAVLLSLLLLHPASKPAPATSPAIAAAPNERREILFAFISIPFWLFLDHAET